MALVKITDSINTTSSEIAASATAVKILADMINESSSSNGDNNWVTILNRPWGVGTMADLNDNSGMGQAIINLPDNWYSDYYIIEISGAIAAATKYSSTLQHTIDFYDSVNKKSSSSSGILLKYEDNTTSTAATTNLLLNTNMYSSDIYPTYFKHTIIPTNFSKTAGSPTYSKSFVKSTAFNANSPKWLELRSYHSVNGSDYTNSLNAYNQFRIYLGVSNVTSLSFMLNIKGLPKSV